MENKTIKNKEILASDILIKPTKKLDSVLDKLESDIKELKKTKSQINKENAEAFKTRKEANLILEDVQYIRDIRTLNKIIVLSDIVLSPFTMSEIKDRPVLTVEGYREEAEAVLMKLIRTLS